MISNQGWVKSLKRKSEWILKNRKSSKGYLRVNFCKNTKHYTKSIHRLVLETFNPIESMNDLEVNHKDGNKENNKLYNLEWCTSSENNKHAYKIGLKEKTKGEINGMSKLLEKDVILIFSDLEEGKLTQRKIAHKFGVSYTTISNIKNGKRWKYMKENLLNVWRKK